MLHSDFTLLRRHVGLHRFLLSSFPPNTRSPCMIRSGDSSLYDMIWWFLLVWYDLVVSLGTIWSPGCCVYNINLRATHTTILSVRGVQIPIDLVSSTTDSIRWRVVLFKPVQVLTSDLKSEFLCQSSVYIVQNLQTPLNTLYTWDISHTFVTTYHPYCQSPSALTKYLKQKLHHQRAKRLGRSLSAQVEQSVPLERNITDFLQLARLSFLHSAHILLVLQPNKWNIFDQHLLEYKFFKSWVSFICA